MPGSGTQLQIIPTDQPALSGTREYFTLLSPFIGLSGELRGQTRLRIVMFETQKYLEGISAEDLVQSPARQFEQVGIAKRDLSPEIEHHSGQIHVAQNLAKALLAPAGRDGDLGDRTDDRWCVIDFDAMSACVGSRYRH